MILTYFLNFDNEFLLLNETFNLKQNIFLFENFFFFFYLINFSFFNLMEITELKNINTSPIIDFINQTEDVFFFNNLENIKTIYHYSIPNTKLAYPEPFIASASLMHSDL